MGLHRSLPQLIADARARSDCAQTHSSVTRDVRRGEEAQSGQQLHVAHACRVVFEERVERLKQLRRSRPFNNPHTHSTHHAVADVSCVRNHKRLREVIDVIMTRSDVSTVVAAQ